MSSDSTVVLLVNRNFSNTRSSIISSSHSRAIYLLENEDEGRRTTGPGFGDDCFPQTSTSRLLTCKSAISSLILVMMQARRIEHGVLYQ
jgi:hypothetical protein